MNDYVINSRLSLGGNSKNYSDSSLDTNDINHPNNNVVKKEINSDNYNNKTNVKQQLKPKRPIARSSHWFAAAGLIFSSSSSLSTTTTTNNNTTSSKANSPIQKSSPQSLSVSNGSYGSNSNERDTFSNHMYNNNNNIKIHSPLSLIPDVSNKTGPPITSVPVFSVEELQAMS